MTRRRGICDAKESGDAVRDVAAFRSKGSLRKRAYVWPLAGPFQGAIDGRKHAAAARQPLIRMRLDLLFDARGFTGQIAQIVQLGATHIAAALYSDRTERRAVSLEDTLHTFAVGNLA